ncbi:MAG: glycosyltransferase family 25 protein [Opitutaceae bacterium]|jgi:glycosyl transferase family 25|nr:glycosyltransferase family 25 protein [Opitutaceae bacterium]
MRVFVINLPHRKDKKEDMLRQGEKHGVPLEMVEAVNGSAFSESQLRELAHDYPACCLTPGVIGCALSHLKIYKKMVDEGAGIALVLEDDAILQEDLPLVLGELEALDKNDEARVYLLSSHYYKARPARAIAGGYSIHKFADGSQGHGYVLNLKAAESLYKNLRPVKWEADKWYYFGELGLASVNCVVPHVVPVDGGAEKSDLYAERILLNKKRRAYLRRLKGAVSRRRRLKKLLWKIFRRPFLRKS